MLTPSLSNAAIGLPAFASNSGQVFLFMDVPSSIRRIRSRARGIAWMLWSPLALLPLAACSGNVGGSAASAGDAPLEARAGMILVKDLTLDVYTGDFLTYKIEAARGEIDKETWIIETSNPRVTFFDSSGETGQNFKGETGELWPVTHPVNRRDGTIRDATSYDWLLRRNVSYQSSEGHSIESEIIRYSGIDGTMTAEGGVRFRLPFGEEGNILQGEARKFVASIDAVTGRMWRWTMTGDISMSSENKK